MNDAAAALFKMETANLLGQYWAGLDAQLTQFIWKKRLTQLDDSASLVYQTDIITDQDFLRPVKAEIVAVEEELYLLSLESKLDEGLGRDDLELLSKEAEVGFWMYNRIDDCLYLSSHLRELIGVDEGEVTVELAQYLKSMLHPADWNRLRQGTKKLLAAPGAFSEHIHFENKQGTLHLRFFAQATGNDLHVTRIFGMVREQAEAADSGGGNDISNELATFSIDQAQEMIFWTRPDGTVAYSNQKVSDVLGYSVEELKNINVGRFTDGFTDEVREEWWNVLRRDKFHRDIWELKTKEGKVVSIDATVNYLRFGEEEYSCGFCRDVTEEQRLMERRRLTEFTIDNSRDLILWVRSDGVIQFVNDTFLNRTGYQRSAVEGVDAKELFPHLESEGRAQAWERLREGETLEGEVALTLENDQHLLVWSRTEYLSFGGQEFSCIYLRDQTKKKKRDIQLLLSREALDASADCKLWLDQDLRVYYLNQTLLRQLGKKRKALIGKLFTAVFPALNRNGIHHGSQIDIKLETATGKHLQLNLSIIQVNHGDRHFYMFTGRDITDLADRRDELEAANAEISKLTDRLQEENYTLREAVSTNYNINNIITVSPRYQKVLQQVGQVADVDTTVLITGETGTGKELLAQAIHQLSERADGPLVKVNCAALPENLIESELFGHEKGAFTGAIQRKRGRFEMADKGTLFLDEVGELPLELQSKLLRVLQEDEFERLGGTETINVDVRLVTATNRNLAEMVRKGTFRADLYYRLNVFPIVNIPLRDRPEDIPVLVEHFANKFAKRQRKTIKKINSADLTALKRYHFPGNIRELENLVERAVVLNRSEVLAIPLDTRSASTVEGPEQFLSFEDMQRQHIIDALKLTGGRITGPQGAGVLLDLNDRTLVSKMRKLKIKKIDYLVK